jgi:hypothetical protein
MTDAQLQANVAKKTGFFIPQLLITKSDRPQHISSSPTLSKRLKFPVNVAERQEVAFV